MHINEYLRKRAKYEEERYHPKFYHLEGTFFKI